MAAPNKGQGKPKDEKPKQDSAELDQTVKTEPTLTMQSTAETAAVKTEQDTNTSSEAPKADEPTAPASEKTPVAVAAVVPTNAIATVQKAIAEADAQKQHVKASVMMELELRLSELKQHMLRIEHDLGLEVGYLLQHLKSVL